MNIQTNKQTDKQMDRPWTTGSGRLPRSKNFKMPFFSRFQKFLSWCTSNRSKTKPKFFSIFFSTNMATGGVQSFCILEGATDSLIEHLSYPMKGIFDILKKVAFWNFSNDCTIQSQWSMNYLTSIIYTDTIIAPLLATLF